MGGSASKQTTKPVWAAGSQEERLISGVELAKQLRGDRSFADKIQEQHARDQIISQGYIDRENVLRSMGRTNGAYGPERFSALRSIEDSKIKGMANLSTQAALGNRAAALQLMTQQSMQAPSQNSLETGGEQGAGQSVGYLAGLSASLLRAKSGTPAQTGTPAQPGVPTEMQGMGGSPYASSVAK